MQKGLIYTNQKQTQEIKKRLYKLSDGICPLLKQHIPIDKIVADHQHKRKAESCSNWDEGGKGLIRGAVSFDANAIEGKIVNAWKRFGMSKHDTSLPDFLRNLADYLENPPAKELDGCFVYYSEKPPRKKIGIREHKRVMKYYLILNPSCRKLPKKLVYVTDDWKRQVTKTDLYIKSIANK